MNENNIQALMIFRSITQPKVLTVTRTKRRKKQVQLKIGQCKLYLYEQDAINLCNSITDQLES